MSACNLVNKDSANDNLHFTFTEHIAPIIYKNCSPCHRPGSGALIPEGKVFPDRCLLVGAPAKVVRELSDEEVAAFQRGVQSYVERARLFRSKLTRIG